VVERPALVNDQVLEEQDVVANSTMNRERGLAGVNSYEKELGIDPIDVLVDRSARPEPDPVAWLDVCCGTGLALVQGAHVLAHRGRRDIRLVGIDLVDRFDSRATDLDVLDVRCTSLAAWRPDRVFDLITCVHGLHYVGDKLAALARLASWLGPGGQLVANLDPRSIRIAGQPSGRQLVSALRSSGFEVDLRRRRICLLGGRSVHLPYRYLGADPAAGPNYTGQPAVDSHYEPVRGRNDRRSTGA
jgi:SAM-dependent methyltransferase